MPYSFNPSVASRQLPEGAPPSTASLAGRPCRFAPMASFKVGPELHVSNTDCEMEFIVTKELMNSCRGDWNGTNQELDVLQWITFYAYCQQKKDSAEMWNILAGSFPGYSYFLLSLPD